MNYSLRKYLQGAANGSQLGNSSQPSGDHKPLGSSADGCCSVRAGSPQFRGTKWFCG